MNQENYKEIAKIMKAHIEDMRDSLDMFNHCLCHECNCGQFKPEFNKQQFLKDCGVE